MKKLNSRGFTIVELMIATAVFSTILVGCAVGMITIGRQLHKADISIGAQNTARSIIEEVGKQVELSSKAPVLAATHDAVCVGSIRYSFKLNTQVENNPDTSKNQGYHGLWRDTMPTSGSCTPANIGVANPGGTDGRELLPLHMRLASFSVINGDGLAQAYPNGNIWDLDVAVVYGDNDVIINPTTSPYNFNCKQTSQGGAFCALSQLHTTVFRRVQ